MAHPRMFDDDDAVLARVRSLALDFPGAAEKISHGRPAFYTTKIFGYYGSSIKVDGKYVQHPTSLTILPDPDEAPALEQTPGWFRPAYLGPYGWLSMDIDERTDWTEVAELLETSYRRTASKKLVAELDAS